MAFSVFSFAILEDSGFYEVDYSFAEKFLHGKGKGCDFYNNVCGSSTK